MVRITPEDFKKLVKILEKEGQDGAFLSFRDDGSALKVETVDKTGRSMLIEISDSKYPFMAKITKTETF